jgi:hypothetical protein
MDSIDRRPQTAGRVSSLARTMTTGWRRRTELEATRLDAAGRRLSRAAPAGNLAIVRRMSQAVSHRYGMHSA